MKKNNIIFIFFMLLIFGVAYVSKFLFPPLLWAYMVDNLLEYFKALDQSATFLTRGIVIFCVFTFLITFYDFMLRKKRYKSPVYKGFVAMMQIATLSVVYFLLGEAVYINTPSKTNIAIFYDDVDATLEALLDVDDVNNKDKTGLRPLEASIMFYNNFDIAKILVDLGADINLPDKNGNMLLTYARKPFESEILNMVEPVIDNDEKQKIIQLLINGQEGVLNAKF